MFKKDRTTTLYGIGTILVALGNTLIQAFEPASIATLVASIMMGLGLIKAKDSDPDEPETEQAD